MIPAFNEEKNISFVLDNIFSTFEGDIIVVDDGSSDNTCKLVSQYPTVILISHKQNLGYDHAISTGLTHVIASNYEFVATFDADGQHRAQDLRDLFYKLDKGADIVVGRRDSFQRVAERLVGIGFLVTKGIFDPFCGLKGYRVSKLKNVALDPEKIFVGLGPMLAIFDRYNNVRCNSSRYLPYQEKAAPALGQEYPANLSFLKWRCLHCFLEVIMSKG